MSSIMDSAADIKIYNYKTKTVHTEKGVVIYDTATNIFKCFGNECVETFDKFRYDKNIIQVAPICMGKIYDFTAAEHLIKWMIDKYVDRADGKKRHFKCSNRAIIYLHEPMSPVDVKAYTDLMYMQGYKNIHVISADTNIAGMTPEEAIRNAEEPLGKLDCAIEITKDSPLEYARYAYETFKKDCKRWGVSPSEIIN
ncbi:MAG: rod shape-determining protein [Butyrivibrio sp.]|nr:rod shape-determining protein [Butyrivibrio sp.]